MPKYTLLILLPLLAALGTGCWRGGGKASTPPPAPTIPPRVSVAEPSSCLHYELAGEDPKVPAILVGIPECPADMPDDMCPPLSRAEEDAVWSFIEQLQARLAAVKRYAARAFRLCGPQEGTVP